VASQCKPAQIRKSSILTQSGPVFWQARGQIVTFAGYAKYWKDLSADALLPQVTPGQPLNLKETGHEKKQTQPPPRYTEAKLVQMMERRGIGRPSTFAPTVKTLKERGYAEVQKRQLQATVLGLEVDAFLGKTLPELLEAEFTALMEDRLDAIASGQENWERYIIGWNGNYFENALKKALKVIESQPQSTTKPLNSSGKESKVECPHCGQKMAELENNPVWLSATGAYKCPKDIAEEDRKRRETLERASKLKHNENSKQDPAGQENDMLSEDDIVEIDTVVDDTYLNNDAEL
jgi:DNA topoisomerase-1